MNPGGRPVLLAALNATVLSIVSAGCAYLIDRSRAGAVADAVVVWLLIFTMSRMRRGR